MPPDGILGSHRSDGIHGPAALGLCFPGKEKHFPGTIPSALASGATICEVFGFRLIEWGLLISDTKLRCDIFPLSKMR